MTEIDNQCAAELLLLGAGRSCAARDASPELTAAAAATAAVFSRERRSRTVDAAATPPYSSFSTRAFLSHLSCFISQWVCQDADYYFGIHVGTIMADIETCLSNTKPKFEVTEVRTPDHDQPTSVNGSNLNFAPPPIITICAVETPPTSPRHASSITDDILRDHETGQPFLYLYSFDYQHSWKDNPTPTCLKCSSNRWNRRLCKYMHVEFVKTKRTFLPAFLRLYFRARRDVEIPTCHFHSCPNKVGNIYYL